MRRWMCLFAVCVLGALRPGGAQAQVSAAGLLGYGIDFEDGDLNPFGLTLGGRAGYTFPSELHLGGALLIHVGDRVTESAGNENTWRMVKLGAELGYDLDTGPLLLRPLLRVGLNWSFLSGKADDVDYDDTETDLYLDLGVAALYPIGRVFVGGDVELMNVFASETIVGLGFFATAGYTFGG